MVFSFYPPSASDSSHEVWKAFKTYKSEREFETAERSDLQEELSRDYMSTLLKVLFHPRPL